MQEQVVKIESRAEDIGVRMTAVLRAAGVDYSTWHRWKNGADGKVHTLQKIEGALTKMEDKAKKGARKAPRLSGTSISVRPPESAK